MQFACALVLLKSNFKVMFRFETCEKEPSWVFGRKWSVRPKRQQIRKENRNRNGAETAGRGSWEKK